MSIKAHSGVGHLRRLWNQALCRAYVQLKSSLKMHNICVKYRCAMHELMKSSLPSIRHVFWYPASSLQSCKELEFSVRNSFFQLSQLFMNLQWVFAISLLIRKLHNHEHHEDYHLNCCCCATSGDFLPPQKREDIVSLFFLHKKKKKNP